MNTPQDKPVESTGPATSGTTMHDDTAGRPAKEDGPLESIGKAISDTVTTAAADEEPGDNGLPAVKPGG